MSAKAGKQSDGEGWPPHPAQSDSLNLRIYSLHAHEDGAKPCVIPGAFIPKSFGAAP